MSDVAVQEKPEINATADNIVELVRANPLLVLVDDDKRTLFLAAVEAEAMKAAGSDISTQAGRERIKSAAADVARLKVKIDTAGKDKTAEWRRLTSEVNAQRNIVEPALQGIQVRVRKPVTDWEDREKARQVESDALIEKLRQSAVITIADTSSACQQRLDDIKGINLNPEVLGTRTEMATDLRDAAVKALMDAIDHFAALEAEREEASRLRQIQEQREAQDRARAQQEQERLETARREEQQRQQAERDRKEAADRAQREADARAAEEREAAERAAREEREAIERRHQEELEAERERARQAEAAAEAERRRVAEEKRQAEAREAAERAEQERREADQHHRTACKSAAKDAIVALGIPEAKADKLVQAIVAGDIPRVTLSF